MKTNKTSPADEHNRHLRAECEARMMEALQHDSSKPIPESDSKRLASEHLATERLAELFVLFPDLKQEYTEMLATLGMMRSHTATPRRKEEEWSALEERIYARIGVSAVPAPTSAITPPKRAQILSLQPIARGLMRFGAVAAIFVGGLIVGRWSISEAQGTQDAIMLARNAALEKHILSQGNTRQSEAENFLHDAHLLMLGVMAMNAECGISHPQALVAQRERCVRLMAQAQELRRTISPEERQRLAHVIVQVECALAELAGTQPAHINASMIRQLQARTDDALCEVNTALAASTRSQ